MPDMEPSCASSHDADTTFKYLLGDRWAANMDYRIEPERRAKYLEAEGWERLVFYSGDSYVMGKPKPPPPPPAPAPARAPSTTTPTTPPTTKRRGFLRR